MPLFACWCHDGEGALAIRERAMADHLAHVEANLERYAVAGPLKDDAGFYGSLLIINATSREDARAFMETDPYAKAGLWSRMDIEPFRGVAGDWVGGAAWKR